MNIEDNYAKCLFCYGLFHKKMMQSTMDGKAWGCKKCIDRILKKWDKVIEEKR